MAKGNRKAFQDIILKWVNEIDPSGMNTRRYEELFARMSDKEIENYVEAIENGDDYVSMNYVNLTESSITIDRNKAVADKMKISFFQRMNLTDHTTGMRYLTPLRYMVIDIPVRRQVQTLEKKVSIPEDNLHVDEMTDQPTGPSKGSGISTPELLMLYTHGFDESILELIKIRGGDTKALREMDRQIAETGEVDITPILEAGTRPKSVETLSSLFKAMHFDNTL